MQLLQFRISAEGVKMDNIREKAHRALCDFIGEGKDFRPGQYEAVEATLTNRRTLVVQRTGWGKTMVYFICTKLLRDEGKGVSIIISPLLVLMSDQIRSAESAGLKCAVLSSEVGKKQKEDIIESMKRDELDIVFTTPETLFSELVTNALPFIRIGLFVVDEAHCISDWGHDFRLDYCHIYKVISEIPVSVPLLATTATADNRVIDDLKKQLGGDVFVSRGPLMRDNLSIQVLKLQSKVERYAWLLENIPKLNGSGIIYCLTRDDCSEIADFLSLNGISARAYFSGIKSDSPDDPDPNTQTERMFMDNKIKVIVATVKLGMGYDKPDIAFVVHYQTPPGIVAYYQQIGRAGRKIDRAYTFIMNGKEDADILEFFRETAFPTEEEFRKVYDIIGSSEGMVINDILERLNMKRQRILNALKFLMNEGLVYNKRVGGVIKYFLTTNRYKYDSQHYAEVTRQREKDYEKMTELLETDMCYSRFVVNALDDKTERNCGLCANCLGREEYPSKVTEEAVQKAVKFLESSYYVLEPRKRWVKASSFQENTIIAKPNETGICLSRYGHPIFGQLVREGKYKDGSFCDRLVDKSAEILKDFIAEHEITALTYVPSLRSGIVADFAVRLAWKLDIPCLCLLKKLDAAKQKEMQNSQFQCENAMKSFVLAEGAAFSGNILLVDDMVDSKWTLTVCGYLLTKAGAEHVFPYALANSSQKDDKE